MSSIKCQKAILELLSGVLDEERPDIHISTLTSTKGGAPAIEAIEDVFVEGGDADDKEIPITPPIPTEVIINSNDNELEEQIPDDDDGKEEVEKDGNDDPVSSGFEQPNNDNSEKEVDELLLITGGSIQEINHCIVINADSKFPWIVKKKQRLD